MSAKQEKIYKLFKELQVSRKSVRGFIKKCTESHTVQNKPGRKRNFLGTNFTVTSSFSDITS